MISKMYEKRLRGDFFRLSIMSLVVVVVWIGMGTYQAFTKDKVTPEVKKQILPLTSSIDAETMIDVRQRLVVPQAEWGNLENKLPEIVIQPEASGSGKLILSAPKMDEKDAPEASDGAGTQ